jgi:anti-sigma28 factor (negative regulator of flagellin synthesis)
MRIENTGGANPAQAVDRATDGAAKTANRPLKKLDDHAVVSPAAELARGANSQRLEALRAAVETGAYNVSSDALARSIVESHIKP